MAKENVMEFMNAVMTDQTLAEKFSALASEQGYSFTAEELLECVASRPISDEATEKVSGGWPK